MQIWTNYETHIFKKLGGTYPRSSRESASEPSSLQRLLRLLLLTLFVKVVQGCKQECEDRDEDKTKTLNGETETFSNTADSDTFL